MLFYSTNDAERSSCVSIREALLLGLAPDRGLYLPERFPTVLREELTGYSEMSYAEIAFRILSRYTAGVLDDDVLFELCKDAYSFEVPLEPVQGSGKAHILRLDQGPTASFKDFAARMMARLISHFIRESGKELTILTATSGDTGAAVASAFSGVLGIKVVVLFPIHEVSRRQRLQMTTLGGNVTCLAIDGKFDDCQAMVKRAFADSELRNRLNISSANSINIGRLLPQSVYYFYAASRISKTLKEPLLFSIPSGNFGDMMGAMIAWKMGLPIKKILVPVNGNDAFPTYLATGNYRKIEPSRNCVSNAMNVGHPSNLARLVQLYGGHMDETGHIRKLLDLNALRRDIFSISVSDKETRQTIIDVWNNKKILLEPHGAVAWKGYESWINNHPEDATLPAAILETAHPAKFHEEMERLLGFEPELPPSLALLDHSSENYTQMQVNYDTFKEFLLTRASK
ncbi:MAG: threonine synthase [Verrucomicrobia bacterium]|nr:threonine synthase [Verrucomicrobiota bacterium]